MGHSFRPESLASGKSTDAMQSPGHFLVFIAIGQLLMESKRFHAQEEGSRGLDIEWRGSTTVADTM